MGNRTKAFKTRTSSESGLLTEELVISETFMEMTCCLELRGNKVRVCNVRSQVYHCGKVPNAEL